jgi:hypothetical protein
MEARDYLNGNKNIVGKKFYVREVLWECNKWCKRVIV